VPLIAVLKRSRSNSFAAQSLRVRLSVTVVVGRFASASSAMALSESALVAGRLRFQRWVGVGQTTFRGAKLRQLRLGRKRNLHCGQFAFCLTRTTSLRKPTATTVKVTKFHAKATKRLMAFPLLLKQRWWLIGVATNLCVHSAVNAIGKLKPNTLALAKLWS